MKPAFLPVLATIFATGVRGIQRPNWYIQDLGIFTVYNKEGDSISQNLDDKSHIDGFCISAGEKGGIYGVKREPKEGKEYCVIASPEVYCSMSGLFYAKTVSWGDDHLEVVPRMPQVDGPLRSVVLWDGPCPAIFGPPVPEPTA